MQGATRGSLIDDAAIAAAEAEAAGAGLALPPGKSLTLRDRRTTWTRRTLPAFCAAGHLSKFRSWCKQIRLICRLGDLAGVIKISSGSL